MKSQEPTVPVPADEEHQAPLRHPLMEANHVSVLFPLRKRLFSPLQFVHAVDDVSLFIRHGETLGLVGESGCGKTTLARALLRLIDMTYGNVSLDGEQLQHKTDRELRPFRKKMQMIFQDPQAAMDPRMTIEQIVAEGIRAHKLARGRKATAKKVLQHLREVELSGEVMSRFPHELSGGERQRVGIARALAVEPTLIMCDEPVASLDVSVQGQILELLLRLQREKGLSYLFISHDLSVLRVVSHRLAVMYLGRIVEEGPTDKLISAPQHPYTKALIGAVPSIDPTKRSLRLMLPGEPPNPADLPEGCPFHGRCPNNDHEKCVEQRPELKQLEDDEQHWVACWYAPVR